MMDDGQASTSCENTYPSDNPEDRQQRMLSLAPPYSLQDLTTYLQLEDVSGTMSGTMPTPPSIIFINPLWLGEWPESLFSLTHSLSKLLIVDAQGFLRRVDAGGTMSKHDWIHKFIYLPLIDVFKIDTMEANVLTSFTDLHRACQCLHFDFGGKIILATETSGVGLLTNDGEWVYEQWGSFVMEGRTGRGDTATVAFIGIMMKGGYFTVDKNNRIHLLTSDLGVMRGVMQRVARITTAKMQYPGPYRGDEAL